MDRHGAGWPGRLAGFRGDAEEGRFQLVRLGVEGRELFHNVAHQGQPGQVGLLIAGALPRAQVGRGEEEQGQVTRSQRFAREVGVHGRFPAILLRSCSWSFPGRFWSLAPHPPPRRRPSSGEKRTAERGLRMRPGSGLKE